MKFDVNVVVHVHAADQHALELINSRLNRIETLGGKIMAALDALQSAVAAERTVVDSAIVLLTGLAAKIAALAPTQEAIDALAAEVGQDTQKLADAVTANTPAE